MFQSLHNARINFCSGKYCQSSIKNDYFDGKLGLIVNTASIGVSRVSKVRVRVSKVHTIKVNS